MEKYALLDTDFISKTHTVRIDDNNHLIDRILEMPEYVFFCHEQTVVELSRHNSYAPEWLKKKIEEKIILCYTDEQIIDELVSLLSSAGLYKYTQMLKIACDAFDRNYFAVHYNELMRINYTEISRDEYLNKLMYLDTCVVEGNNLGEIKEYILLQVLNLFYGDKVYVFCSDDHSARNGILNIDEVQIQCITLLSSFFQLRKESCYSVADAEPYIKAALEFYHGHKQTLVRVVEATEVKRMQRITCEQALYDIFADKFIKLKNGLLKYKE